MITGFFGRKINASRTEISGFMFVQIWTSHNQHTTHKHSKVKTNRFSSVYQIEMKVFMYTTTYSKN